MTQAHILVVDDDPINVEILEVYLTRRGFQVSTASSGLEALDLCLEQKIQYDLIVMDVVMPDMTGFDVLTLLRADRNYEKTPVICYSASVGPAAVAAGKLSGCNVYIIKPARPAEILAAVQKLLAGSPLE